MMKKTFLLKSTSAALTSLRRRLGPLIGKAGFSPRERDSVLLAMGEACANAIRHSYGGRPGHLIRITLQDAKDRMVFKIRDFGEKIDLARVRTPRLPPRKGGGLGIYFMKESVDELKYNTSHRWGNELILIKYKKRQGTRENPNQRPRARNPLGRSRRRS